MQIMAQLQKAIKANDELSIKVLLHRLALDEMDVRERNHFVSIIKEYVQECGRAKGNV